MMKKLRLILILSLCAVLMSCRGASQTVTGYAFHDLVVDLPSSCEITKLEEQDNPPLASFVLVDKDNADSQIEFAISEFDKDFLSTVPREELMGELVASVFDMKENVLSAPGVVAEKIGEMTVSRKGERLGLGGGYYDRFLERCPQAVRMALAFSFQLVEELPVESHDITVDWIITEQEYIKIKERI